MAGCETLPHFTDKELRQQRHNTGKKTVNRKDLLCSPGDYIQYLVVTYNGKEYICVCMNEKEYICITESLAVHLKLM